LFGASEDPLHDLVVEQGQRAVKGADLLVFLVDGRDGLVPGDEQIAGELRRTGRPVLLAINKTDDKRARDSVDFYRFGFEPVFEISAEHGQGVAELMDAIVDRVGVENSPSSVREEHPRRYQDPSETRVAIVGRPNVGKSSLVNLLLREQRVLVSDLPGTTRDAIDVGLTWHRQRFRIVDTAGMRRPGRVAGGGKVEVVSVALAKESIAHADVVVLMLDADEGATDQDAAIGGEVDRAGRGIVIVANKWDLMKGGGKCDSWTTRRSFISRR
jgi:GTP-binding protein